MKAGVLHPLQSPCASGACARASPSRSKSTSKLTVERVLIRSTTLLIEGVSRGSKMSRATDMTGSSDSSVEGRVSRASRASRASRVSRVSRASRASTAPRHDGTAASGMGSAASDMGERRRVYGLVRNRSRECLTGPRFPLGGRWRSHSCRSGCVRCFVCSVSCVRCCPP